MSESLSQLDQDFISAWTEGHYPEAIALLEKGANPDARTEDMARAAMHVACATANAEFVEVLLRHGADPNLREIVPQEDGSRPAIGLTPLLCLTGEIPFDGSDAEKEADRLKIMRMLIGAGAEVDATAHNTGATALMWAVGKASFNSTAYAKLLIGAGANPGTLYQSFWNGRATHTCVTTPVIAATGSGTADALCALVYAGADLSLEPNNPSDPSIERALTSGGRGSDRSTKTAVVNAYRTMPQLAEDADLSRLTKAALLDPGDTHLQTQESIGMPKGATGCLLDNPKTWRRIGEIFAALARNGEYFTKQELLADRGGGNSLLSFAVQCRALPMVFSYLEAQGEAITTADLVQPGGNISNALQEMILYGDAQKLAMHFDRGIGSNMAFRRSLLALPQEAKDQISMQSLLARRTARATEAGLS